MAHLQSDRILSQPCEVFWAGFRSNTYLLQQQGWEIAAEQDYANMSIRILMRHQDLKLFALSRRENFDFYRHAGEYTPPPIFYVNNCATRYEVTSIMDRFENFKQIDSSYFTQPTNIVFDIWRFLSSKKFGDNVIYIGLGKYNE